MRQPNNQPRNENIKSIVEEWGFTLSIDSVKNDFKMTICGLMPIKRESRVDKELLEHEPMKILLACLVSIVLMAVKI
jgi:hypothetical protein